jgi:hypothetical protein
MDILLVYILLNYNSRCTNIKVRISLDVLYVCLL